MARLPRFDLPGPRGSGFVTPTGTVLIGASVYGLSIELLRDWQNCFFRRGGFSMGMRAVTIRVGGATTDPLRRKHPEYSGEKLMRIGRYVTVIFMLLAVLWAPQIENFGSLFKYLQNILAYAVPPVVVLFLFGSFWSRANSQGANATIAVGLVSATALFIGIEIMQLVKLHFLLVAPIVFALSAIAMVVASLMTPAPSTEAIAQYLWTPGTYKKESEELAGVTWYANYRFQSLILVMLSIFMLISFW